MTSSPQAELPRILRSFRGLFVAVAAFSLAVNLLMLAPSLYMLQVYDRVLASRNLTTLLMISVLVAGLFALESMLEWVRGRALVRGSAAIDLALGPRVFDAAFERHLLGGSAGAGQALADVGTVRQFLTGKGLVAFLDAPWTPVYLAVAFLLHPWLALFGAGAVALLLLLAWINEKATAAPLLRANQEALRAGHFATTQLRNAEVLHAMGMLRQVRERWLDKQLGTLSLQARASDRAGAIAAATRFARLAAQSGVLGFGALLVIDNRITPGAMIAASILLGRALSPVDQAMASWRGLVSARAAYARLNDLLSRHPEAPRRTALPRPTGRVTVEGLVAGPPGTRQPVLKGIRFGATPGMRVAVVGPSASGKSTLARSLVGVWPPLAGTVRLDGAEVHLWDKAELGPWIGYLPQDVELLEGTVAENISRFGPRDDAAIVRAAQRAGVHEMILRLPQGYETPVGEEGAALSGGQRQRIGLARALYGEPALLVLDEPDAHLDESGEAALASVLRQLKEERCTVFVVSHRRKLLAEVDAVLVLAGGAIQAYGPREQVLESAQHPKALVAPPNAPAREEIT